MTKYRVFWSLKYTGTDPRHIRKDRNSTYNVEASNAAEAKKQTIDYVWYSHPNISKTEYELTITNIISL